MQRTDKVSVLGLVCEKMDLRVNEMEKTEAKRVAASTLAQRAGGVHKGHFHIPGGMVVRGGRRQSICQPALHMSQRSIFSSSNGL